MVDAVLHFVNLHVGHVIGGDGHVVLGLHVGLDVTLHEQHGLVTDGTLMVALLAEFGLPKVFNVRLHLGLVCLVDVGSEVGGLDSFVTNLTDCQTFILVIIAEHAVSVDLSNREFLYPDPAHVLVPVVPQTDLVLGKVGRQPAPVEENDSLADVTLVVGRHYRARLTVDCSVVSKVYPVPL